MSISLTKIEIGIAVVGILLILIMWFAFDSVSVVGIVMVVLALVTYITVWYFGSANSMMLNRPGPMMRPMMPYARPYYAPPQQPMYYAPQPQPMPQTMYYAPQPMPYYMPPS